MNKIIELDKKKIQVIVTCILFVVVQAVFTGCSGSYGRLKPSLEVDKMFEELKILTDHSYYYSGPDSVPTAIIGIDNNYTLKSKFWKPVDITSAQLKRWIDNLTGLRGYTATNWGSLILDHTGKRLGVWYSRCNETTVKMESDKIIVISTPTINDDNRRKSGNCG